jgi:hypothetical protein
MLQLGAFLMRSSIVLSLSPQLVFLGEPYLTSSDGIVSKGIFFAFGARVFVGASHMWSTNTLTLNVRKGTFFTFLGRARQGEAG